MHLTNQEALLIHRRRLGLTQGQMAKRCKMTRTAYLRVESGRVARSDRFVKKIGPLRVCERCYITRRRRGRSQQVVANELGWSRYWLNLVEQGKTSEISERRLAQHLRV